MQQKPRRPVAETSPPGYQVLPAAAPKELKDWLAPGDPVPSGVAVLPDGGVYVTDAVTHTVLPSPATHSILTVLKACVYYDCI